MSELDDPLAPEVIDGRVDKKLYRWLSRLIIITACLLLMTVAGAAVYLKTVDNNMQRQDLLGDSEWAANNTGAINFVILGSDSRDPTDTENGRSDVVMVMHLDGDRRHAYLVSFPRAMYVDIPGHGLDKINQAFPLGGPQLTVKTLEKLTNTRMDHVVLADFDGFVELTEELGGVTINNRYASQANGFTFPAGRISLKGDAALAYVRQRVGLPGGDLDRAERQRVVMQAVLAKGLSKETMANPVKFNRFVKQVSTHLTVDNALTAKKIRKTAVSLRMTGSDVSLVQVAMAGHAFDAKGNRIQPVDPVKLKALSTALLTDTMDQYVKVYPGG